MNLRRENGRIASGSDGRPFRVLVTTEATYPFHWGGLSTWCHKLIEELPDIEFSLLAVVGDPFAELHFEFPANLVDFRALPLWGLRHAWELDRRRSVREALRKRRSVSKAVIESGFVPSYRTLVGQMLGEDRDDERLAQALLSIYRFVGEHDFDQTLRSRAVWDAFTEEAATHYPRRARAIGYEDTRASLAELTSASQWLYHWLLPLAQPLPRVDIAHATMAGICSLVAVVCKLDQGAGFVLSEHGIYLRESYLAEHTSSASLFGKVFKLGFARRMTELAYTYVDVIAPCCNYNHRWERRVGADQERIRTAYYGIDASTYAPKERTDSQTPIVAWAGRIDPLKDVETLLKAAAVVHEVRPDVRFRLYGSAPPGNESYNERCRALHRELDLEEVVSFEGFSSNVIDAFSDADLVVLSSISEGFPFSTLEAMLCGRPVVATSVGGISEQVTDDCGRVVRPRDPQALGAAILDVLSSPETCTALAREARERAVALFGIERFRETHRTIYEVAVSADLEPPAVLRQLQAAGCDSRTVPSRQQERSSDPHRGAPYSAPVEVRP